MWRRGKYPRSGILGALGNLLRMTAWIIVACVVLNALVAGSAAASDSAPVRVAVIQMAICDDLEKNCQKMVGWVERAARENVRVVVFPEAALWAGADQGVQAAACRERLSHVARGCNVYIIFGECLSKSGLNRPVQVGRVLDPAGQEIFHYVKHHDVPTSPLPGVFPIDGIPTSLVICADRWLRTVEELPIQLGARISIELSANFAEEWVPALGWYWYVARAVRNNVWVVFANSAANVDGAGHGHSAVIAPDGTVVASLPDDREAMLLCDIDPQRATRHEALRRSRHPALESFWKAGLLLYEGIVPDGDARMRRTDQPALISLAATTVAGDWREMAAVVAEAKSQGADLLVFPSRACRLSDVDKLQQVARQHGLTLAFGVEPETNDAAPYAVVVGKDGNLITEVFPLSADKKLQGKPSVKKMLFTLNGVRALVVVEDDILWTELVELASVHGARVLVHLAHTENASDEARQRQLQVWATAASYQMFSVMADRQQAALWEDLNPRAERHSVIDRQPIAKPPAVEIFSPFSANLIRSSKGPAVIVARCSLGSGATYFEDRVNRYPSLKAWLLAGQSCFSEE